jgi:hypothetical protein
VLPPGPWSFASIYSPASESTIGYLPFWPVLLGGIYELYALIGMNNQYLYYFMLKQPMIIGDVLLGYLILRYVRANRPEAKNAVLAFWLLSPYTIVISSVWGMFDSLAMVPVVAALLTTRPGCRSSLEGLAIWIKSIPLIYAIPFAFSGPKKFRNLAISIAIPTLGSVGIILVAGWPIMTAATTLNSTVTKGGQSLSLLGVFFYLIQFNIVTTWQPALLTFLGYLWIPAEIVTFWLAYRWHGFSSARGLLQSLILCTITFMIFKAQVNEQYAVYLLALTLIDVAVWNPGRKWLYVSITVAVMTFLILNNVFLVRFTAPVNPGWISTENALVAMTGAVRPAIEQLSSLVFVALNVLYFRMIYRDRKPKTATADAQPAGENRE